MHIIGHGRYARETYPVSPGVGIVPEATAGTIRYPIGTAAAQSSTQVLPTGAVVSDAQVEVDTPYSAGATIEVGQTGSPSLFAPTSSNVPQSAALYDVPQDTPAANLAVLTTVGGAPGAGAGFIIVKWAIPST